MSMQLQSTSTVLSVSLEKTEPLTAIKNEPPDSEIGIDDIPDSLDEEIIPDVKDYKDIDIVSHVLSEDLIKSETVSENTFENNHSGFLGTQVFVKTEHIPLIKTENITQNEYLYKTQDTADGNVSRDTSQVVIEAQRKEGTNEHFNALQNDKQFVNFFKDISDINREAKCPIKTDFSECYETVETTSCEKDRKKENVIEVPVISYCCEKCTFISKNYSYFKQHKLSHKTEAEVDGRYLKYCCDICKYKTCYLTTLNRHKLMHLKPEQIPYFYCYHCPYKCKQKGNLKVHIFSHFKNEEVPFHCYICDFTTLKRNVIIEHFKKYPKHHSKCDETDYKSQLQTYLKYHCDKCKYKTYCCQSLKAHKLTHLKPEEIQYFYCYHCSYKSDGKQNLKKHIFRHFKNEEIPFHCYICDFTTLKRNLITEHFKKHPKHHSKCDYTKKQIRYCCEKCTYTSGKPSAFKLHQLIHETKAEIDDRLFKYRCDKCKFKTYWCTSLKVHKLKHLKPEEIQYFYCYHCFFKSHRKYNLQNHIFRHFKNEEIPFHCYICDFVTLKREYFNKHLNRHNKCDETEYRNQLVI